MLLKQAAVFPCCPHRASASSSGLPTPGKRAAGVQQPLGCPHDQHPRAAARLRVQPGHGTAGSTDLGACWGLGNEYNNPPGTTLSYYAWYKAVYSQFWSNFSCHSQAQNSGAGWGRFSIPSEKLCQVDPSGHSPDIVSLEGRQRGTSQAGTASGRAVTARGSPAPRSLAPCRPHTSPVPAPAPLPLLRALA